MDEREYDGTSIEHMMNPRNYGRIEDADGQGIGKNPTNGEMVIVYLSIEGERIVDIRFQAKACMTAIVAGSIFTETIKGSTVEKAREMADLMLQKLESMPLQEVAACSEMVAEAFLAALEHYEARRKDPDTPVPTRMISRSCPTTNQEGEDG